MGKPEEEGVFAGSGSIRVDPERAKEMLGRFGYAELGDAFVAFARCAVLSGAPEIDFYAIESAKEGMSLGIGFRGRAFAPQELSNPAGGLLDNGTDRDRKVALARAYLTLAATQPKVFTLEGQTGGKFVARLRWDKDRTRVIMRDMPAYLRRRCAYSPIPVRVGFDENGYWMSPELIYGQFPEKPYTTFRGEGVRGWLSPARAGAEGAVDLYWGGAQVERLGDLSFLPAPVDGFLERADFALDLSEHGIVRDEVYEQAQKQLLGGTFALIERALAEPNVALDKPELAHWLRRCACRATASDPTKKALCAAPLYWTTDGRVLSLEELDRQRDAELVARDKAYLPKDLK